MHDDTPTARWVGHRRSLLLAMLPFTVAVVWGTWHAASVAAAFTGHGNPMALTWAGSFLLLWWVVVAWFESPATVTPRQQRQLDELTVTVQVPVYNEDPYALYRCLLSLFEQSRRPNRVHVVDDGSSDPESYETVKAWFLGQAHSYGIAGTWTRTPNRGKRHAQMTVLADDDGDIFLTLDSDSVLERQAIDEGLKPFADPQVMSVAGMVVVWNAKTNFLTMLTCMLYTSFTRGFRSAQSVLGQVMVNSGTLAFYRGWVIREFAGAYENERLFGRAMQMNDDSFMTFAAMLQGKTVHQPSSVAFTLVPENLRHYFNQQLRWMRGTFVRQAWWFRYLSPRRFAFWMPALELLGFVLSFFVVGYIAVGHTFDGHRAELLATTAVVGVLLNYTIALRYFIISRSDESRAFTFATFLLAPVAGLWRLAFLRLLMLYAMATFWRVGKWGTRERVEVGLESRPAPQPAWDASTRELVAVAAQ